MQTSLVESKEDEVFLFEVYASSRVAEISLWGWTDEQQQQFLRMQYEAQQRYYLQQYSKLRYSIILFEGKRVGRIAVVRQAREWIIVDIILLPEFQNRGLGSSLMRELQREAVNKNTPIRLSVFADSPAQQFYERLGFLPVAGNGVYIIMKWLPMYEVYEG